MDVDVKVVQTMIDTMVGVPRFSYPARQNDAPKPADEFAHVRLLEEYQVSIPTQIIAKQTTDETVFRTISAARLRFRVGVVDTRGDAAVRIMHGWTSEAMKTLMISSGYGFRRCTPLSNEDAKLEREWEYRVGFSVEFYVTRIFEETVNNIRALEVAGVYVTPGLDEYLLNFEINEP